MHFEKVKFEAFRHDMMLYRPLNYMSGQTVEEAYEKIVLPERKTKYSCGYDVRTPLDVVLSPGRSIVIPTGIKVVFNEDEMMTWHLKLYARSSVGIKDRVVVTNGVGLIDSDFQYSDNDGDMLLALTNMSDSIKKYEAGDRVCQAVFEIFGITSDDAADGARVSGVGSTGIN